MGLESVCVCVILDDSAEQMGWKGCHSDNSTERGSPKPAKQLLPSASNTISVILRLPVQQHSQQHTNMVSTGCPSGNGLVSLGTTLLVPAPNTNATHSV